MLPNSLSDYPPLNHSAPRVLVVEDDVLIRFMVADHLRESGFVVIEALNGDEAIEVLAAGASIDLVFTDVRMPGSADGMDVLNFVQRTRPDLPVVITSGHLDPRLAQAGGAAQFLPKPCSLDTLVEALNAALERPA